MPRVRLTASAYEQPDDFAKPNRDQTTTRRQGDVFDVSAAERDRLFSLGAAEEYEADKSPDKALLDFAEAHLKRQREEHETLRKRDGVSKREVELSAARLQDAERQLEQAKGKSGKG